MSGRAPRASTAITLGVAGLVTLIVMALTSFRPLIYDESAYVLDPPALLDRAGLTLTWFRTYPYAGGLSFGLLQTALRPLTHLNPHFVRLVNPLLFVVLMVVVRDLARRCGGAAPTATALAMLSVPYVWAFVGLALTEMAGLLPAMLGLWGFMVLLARADSSRAWRRDAWLAFASGVVAGAAFYSRPHLLTLLGAPAVALAMAPQTWSLVLPFWAGAVAAVAPAVVAWGGLVPPQGDFPATTMSFSGIFLIESLGYAGAAMWCITPRWFRLKPGLTVALAATGLLANVVLRLVTVSALSSIAARVLPRDVLPYYPAVAGGVIVALAFVFTAATAQNLWENRRDRSWLVLASALCLVIVGVGGLSQQFSSRYPGIAAPLMALSSDRYRAFTRLEHVALAIGCGLGALSLGSYLYL